MTKNKHTEKLEDDIFDLDLDRVVKKAKRRTLLRNSIISTLVVLLLFIGSIMIGEQIKQNQRSDIEVSLLTLFELAKPNQYLGEQKRFEGFANGQLSYTTYKWLDNTLVYTGENHAYYGFPKARWTGTGSPSIIGETTDDTKAYPSYNPLGQREMLFYYPYVRYSQLPNDFEVLAQIPDHKVAELALSFDQIYTLADLQQFVPANAEIAWYWLDDIGEENANTLTYTNDHGTWNRVRSEHSAFGVKALNAHREVIQSPFEWFLLILENSYNDRNRLKQGEAAQARLKDDLERLYDRFLRHNPEKDINQLPIAGIVVTGDRESLSVWQEVEQIRAVSLGATADRY